MASSLKHEAQGKAPADAAPVVVAAANAKSPPESAGWERKDLWNDRRIKLLDWLKRQPGASELAVAYEAAITLMSLPHFVGRARLICHAMRDIADELPVALAGKETFSQTNYAEAISSIITDWPQNFLQNEGPRPEKDTVEIPRRVFLVIDKLVQVRRRTATGSQKADAMFRALLKLDPNSGPPSAILINTFKKLRKWLVNRAHFSAGSPKVLTEDELVKEVERFEHIIHSCINRFFSTTDALDGILNEANK